MKLNDDWELSHDLNCSLIEKNCQMRPRGMERLVSAMTVSRLNRDPGASFAHHLSLLHKSRSAGDSFSEHFVCLELSLLNHVPTVFVPCKYDGKERLDADFNTGLCRNGKMLIVCHLCRIPIFHSESRFMGILSSKSLRFACCLS